MAAFLIDAQLPRSLCVKIQELGHVALHVSALAATDASDDAIWMIAADRQLVIVSKDEDFAQRVVRSTGGPAVVWIRLGNGPNAALWAALAPIWAEICASLDAGERLVEVV